VIVDEVGYIPFDPQAANLMFMLVSRRYERARRRSASLRTFARRDRARLARGIALDRNHRDDEVGSVSPALLIDKVVDEELGEVLPDDVPPGADRREARRRGARPQDRKTQGPCGLRNFV
jgi:hypothetical protein